MISRGEVGLIIAGIGLTAGAISQDVYAQIVAMAVITTIITPILLRHSYRKEAHARKITNVPLERNTEPNVVNSK